jgi:hypothetical protein
VVSSFEGDNEPSVPQSAGNFLMAEELLATNEGPCFMELSILLT